MPGRFALLLVALLPACIIDRRALTAPPSDAPTFDAPVDAPRFDTLADAGPEIDAALEVRVDAPVEGEDAPMPVVPDAWSFPDAGRDAPPAAADAAMTTCGVVVMPSRVRRGGRVTGMVSSNGSSCLVEIVGVIRAIPCMGMADFVIPDWAPGGSYRVTLQVLAGPGGPVSCGVDVLVE
jgi:hypothetical protein